MVWQSRADAIAAADAFIETASHLEVRSWSNRELQLECAAAGIASEMVRLHWVHPFCLAVYVRLHNCVNEHLYPGLVKAIQREGWRQLVAKLFPGRPDGMAD